MRQPKPFFRKQTQTWYVPLGRRQINLVRDRKQAWQAYHELMSREAVVHEQPVTAAELCELYLEWCQQRRAAGTYEKIRRYLRSFIDEIGRRCPISKLRTFHDLAASHLNQLLLDCWKVVEDGGRADLTRPTVEACRSGPGCPALPRLELRRYHSPSRRQPSLHAHRRSACPGGPRGRSQRTVCRPPPVRHRPRN